MPAGTRSSNEFGLQASRRAVPLEPLKGLFSAVKNIEAAGKVRWNFLPTLKVQNVCCRSHLPLQRYWQAVDEWVSSVEAAIILVTTSQHHAFRLAVVASSATAVVIGLLSAGLVASTTSDATTRTHITAAIFGIFARRCRRLTLV